MPNVRFTLVVLLIAADLTGGGGDLAARKARQEQPIFRAGSELVVLHVSVRDRGGRYVTGLTRDAFTVIDDGQAQTLEMFSADEVPASIAFLVDNSNSMQPNRERVIASAVAFAANSHPEDEISVLTFNEQVRTAFGPTVIGDMQPGSLGRAMAAAITARGMTAIFDGILAGLDRVTHGVHTRQVLVLVSDGKDNASRATKEEALAAVRQSDATIYSVILVDPLMRDGDPGLLRRLAAETGGESFQPRSVEDVPAALDRIAKDIRSAYTLAYAPTHTGEGERRRRTVRVYVRSPDRRSLSVRTRDGYFEHPEAGQR